jgi:hypothetical protein
MARQSNGAWRVLVLALLGLIGACIALSGVLFGGGPTPETVTRRPTLHVTLTPTPTALLPAEEAPAEEAEPPLTSPTGVPVFPPTPTARITEVTPLSGGTPPSPVTATAKATVEASSTPEPTKEPSPQPTENPLIRTATQVASIYDDRATADSSTATAGPPPPPPDAASQETPPSVAMLSRGFVIYDESGERLGAGRVRVYAPEQIALGETGEIRLEIQVDAVTGQDTPHPLPSPTPLFSTPRPTPSPLPLIESQFVVVREYMGAGLRGVDLSRFRADAVPPGGLRRLYPEAVNWWKWNITPVGEEALGINRLEIYIYLPYTRSDGTSFNQETNTVPLQIEVVHARRGLFGGGPAPLGVIVAALAAVGGAGGALTGALRFVQARRQERPTAPTPHEAPGGDDEISVSVGGDVGGQVTIAGDDVITYQTVVQQAPVALVIGVIAGLIALVIGLVVIVLVVSGTLAVAPVILAF